MSFGGMIPERKTHIMRLIEQDRQIKDHFDILGRALRNAREDVGGSKSGMLDHLDHIETELGRLRKTCQE